MAKSIVEALKESRKPMAEEWVEGRKNAQTVEEKTKYNVWDDIRDVLPVLKKSIAGEWNWGRNRKCKYIEVRIDMRDGKCIIKDRHGNRINPEDLRHQD